MMSEDGNLKLEKISPKKMLVILRDFSLMERNMTRALKKIRECVQ